MGNLVGQTFFGISFFAGNITQCLQGKNVLLEKSSGRRSETQDYGDVTKPC